MNIQVSVMVWTVICFLLLVLILQKLLFAPMLRMMDARTARIAAAKKRHEDNENAEKAAKAAADEAFRESTVKAKNDAERMIVQGQEEADRLLAAARNEEQNECERYAKSLDADKSALSAEVAGEAEKLAALFVSRLTS